MGLIKTVVLNINFIIRMIILMFVTLTCLLCFKADTFAEESGKQGKLFVRDDITKDRNVSWRNGINEDYSLYGVYQGNSVTYNIGFLSLDNSRGGYDFNVVSADTSSVAVSGVEPNPDNGDTTGKRIYYNYMFNITINTCCDTLITVKYGKDTYTIRCRFFPKTAVINEIIPGGRNIAYINFQKVIGAEGYYVFKKGDSGWEEYELVKGDVDRVTVTTNLTSDEAYAVCPAIQYGEGGYTTPFRTLYNADGKKELYYCDVDNSIAIDSSIVDIELNIIIETSGAVSISWNALKGAVGYKVYSSLSENTGYTLLSDVGKELMAKDILSAEQTRYYYVEAMYPDGSSIISDSSSVSYANIMDVEVSKQKIKKYSLGSAYQSDASFVNGNYYTLVSPKGKNKIMVEMIDTNSGKRKKRIITVGKYNTLGGAFKLEDGNIYVVTGTNNIKESKTKNVISVIKYDSDWKKLGECKIKGNAVNEFVGIVDPFEFGNVDMIYSDRYVYLKTCRIMFRTPDGLNHQTNIQFVIDTTDMTYRCAEECYVSHSFAQYVAVKGGSLYQADLGDAYPRSLTVNITDNYNPQNGKDENSKDYEVIKFKGKLGDNYVNASLKGLEVGKTNVLTCGTSAPHYMKISGVTGWKKNENIYVGVTNRKTGKTNVVWITNDNPKKKNYSYEVMLFSKINDDRFAILYSKENTKKETYNIYCSIIDNSGKLIMNKCVRKVKELVYSDMTTPVYNNGRIMWIEPVYKKKTVVEKWNGKKYKYKTDKYVSNVLYTLKIK